ncbi:MAG TPA: amino acid adenylation domain-containing protein, partial [Longimicrobium sp.]|nr:amino acid adenylation domain-containing protein [Longimicrobium sp.]
RPARSLAYTPLFQVMLAWQNAPAARLHLPGVDVVEMDDREATAKFDLSLSLAEAGGRIAGELAYATALFDRATAERYAGYLRAALAAMAADDRLRVDDLPLLDEEERRLVVEEWNATAAAYPADDCIHRLVQARARRTPGAVAVVHEGARLTCAQVDGSAARLARALRTLGVGRGAFVPVLAERGPAAPVAMLAAIKAGAAFVPLDPAWPDERLRAAVRDLDPAVVLADAASAERAAALGRPVLVAGVEAGDGDDADDVEALDGGVGAGDAVYAIYTSGSTGVPKAAVVHHGGIANRFGWMSARFGAESAACVLQTTRHVFDSAVWQLFWPMAHGGRAVIPRDGGEADAGYLLETIGAEGVTMTDFVPSVFNALLPDLVADAGARERLASLRTVVVGGEQITAETTYRFLGALPGVRVVNLYGPTECSIGSICHEVRDDGGERIPIGTPISNTRALLLDRRGRPVPRGAAGEIHLGGRCVGLGYRGDPRRTAAAFVPDPFGEPGARLYRTGDLGRHRADGSIEYLGRIDQQVKVRGFRIEPGEIEARLRAHPAVREAVVVAREDAPGERRLVAYVAGGAVEAGELRAHLAAHLPGPMVPAAFVWLDALPLTPNGKLDRRALPAPGDEDASIPPYEPPAGAVETVLAGIWAEVLGVERVGRRDHFFERGGHSLLAVRLVSRVRRRLDAAAALRDLFERPVLADFARGLAPAADADRSPIGPVDRGGPLPLSPAQRRLWFLEQLGGLGGAWHVSERLRLRGALDVAALRRALDRIAARHEALRTTFAAAGGEPEQRIAPARAGAFPLAMDDLAGDADAEAALRRIVAGEARAPFDLERGPLVRGRLVRLARDDHALLLTLHHLVSDGWSTDVLVHELGALYGAFARGEDDPLPPLAVQYADWAAWHRRRMDGGALDAQAEHWRRALSGAPPLLALPADRPRPARQDPAGETLPVALDQEASAAVRTLSRRHGTTPFMTVLAAWAAVLGRLAGQEDVVVGTLSANRGREEVEGMIGFFVDTLALRVDLAGSPSAAGLLARVRARTLEAQQHADLPFERVVELVQPPRSLAHHPLFQVMLSWEEARRSGPALPGLRIEALGVAPEAAARFDLWLALRDADGRIAGDVTYAAALFDRATVERWLGALARLLREMAADDARAVDRLPLLSDAERRRLVDGWNATEAAYPRELCIHHLFEAQAARTPGAVAVVAGGGALTYAELDARAGRLARRLRARGVGPESRVALCVERGVEMVVALLGVLKAGGAYVPLDPSHPADRLGWLLRDAAPAAVLVHGDRRAEVDALLGALEIPLLGVDD